MPSADPTPAVAELFEVAVRLHSRRLLAIARAIAGNRAAAEDIVQQALTNLFQHRDRYDWRDPGQSGALMRRAVVNEALRLLRQPRMSSVSDDHPEGRGARGAAGRSSSPLEPVGGMIDRETVQRVRQAIDRLPEHFRAALVLCEYEGMAYVQIAEVLGASVPQVKTWLHRGRRQLAGMLKEFMAAEPVKSRGGLPERQEDLPDAKKDLPAARDERSAHSSGSLRAQAISQMHTEYQT